MSWKASAIAALIVIAAGAATGVVIGGKTETEVRTVTVAGEVTTVAGAPSTASTSTGASTTPGEPGTTQPSEKFVQYLDADENPTQNDNINIVIDQEHPRDQIGGETVEDALIVELFGNETNGPASVTYSPKSPAAQYVKARMGFEHGTESGADISVDFREDTERGRKLIHTLRFDKPGPQDVTVPLGGAKNVVIVFNNNTCGRDSNRCIYDVTFVLGEARFTDQ